MKYCETFAALLDPYLDGELSPEEMTRVREPLDHCSACRAYVDDALAIRANFPGVEDTPVPAGFAETVCAAVRAGAAPRKRRTAPWARALLPLAACLAVVVLLQSGPLSAGRKNSVSAAYDTAAASADAGAEECAPAEPETPMEAPAGSEIYSDAAFDDGQKQTASKTIRDVPEGMEDPAAPAPQTYGLLPGEDSAPAAGSPESGAEAWVEHGNVVFRTVVYLTSDYVGGALDGCEGKPYSDADHPEDGVIGTGYALEQEDFERILYEELGYRPELAEDRDRTTELSCIVITDAAYAAG